MDIDLIVAAYYKDTKSMTGRLGIGIEAFEDVGNDA